MIAHRAALLVAAAALAGCDSILGLHKITADGEPVSLLITVTDHGIVQQPLGQVSVIVLDVTGQPVETYAGEIKIALGANPNAAALLGTTSVEVTDGRARFDLVGIDRAGTGYTLVATADGLPPVTSGAIAITEPAFQPVPTGIAGGPIESIAVSPPTASGTPTVFVGAGDGVHRSGNAGVTWVAASFNGTVRGRLLADPSQPGTLYLSAPTSSGLKKTVDGGATWHQLKPTYIDSVTLSPSRPSVLYALGSGGVQRSADSGATWDARSSQGCRSIVADGASSDVVYCSSYDSQGRPAGIVRSSDAGATWTSANTGLPTAPFNDVRLVGATPSAVFVSIANQSTSGLYRSIDAGTSWARVSEFTEAIAYAPSMPTRVYAAQGGIAVSNDGGATFAAPVGLPTFGQVRGLAVDPGNPNLAYAVGTAGAFVTANGGTSWSASAKGIDAHPISSLAMLPGTPGTLLATTPEAVLRTTTGGASWTTVQQGSVTAWFDPAVSARAYLCGFNYFATSNNSGASFTGSNVTGVNGTCSRLLIGTSIMYIASYSGLWRSIDGGAKWTNAGVGGSEAIYDAAFGDPFGATVVAATRNAVFRSTNGTSFTQVFSDGDNFNGKLISDPKLPTRVLLGGCPKLRLSIDGGETFGRTTDDLCVSQLWSSRTALYAYGSTSNGRGNVLQTSIDGGSSWSSLDVSGLPDDTQVTAFAASDDGKTIYVGTDAGIYRSVR